MKKHIIFGFSLFIANLHGNESPIVEFEPLNYFHTTKELTAAVALDVQVQSVEEWQSPLGLVVIVQIGRGSGRTVSKTYIYVRRTEFHNPDRAGLYLTFCYVPYGDFVFVKKSDKELQFISVYRELDPVIFTLPISMLFNQEILNYERIVEEKRAKLGCVKKNE
jgi:hypothetical protein